ncbi:MAG: hypothetical protein D6746_10835 [Bacteroidetes bacterium]|nr:MAG: hypothetical protein D6746_10835 [Bacteroidota bacterium]
MIKGTVYPHEEIYVAIAHLPMAILYEGKTSVVRRRDGSHAMELSGPFQMWWRSIEEYIDFMDIYGESIRRVDLDKGTLKEGDEAILDKYAIRH